MATINFVRQTLSVEVSTVVTAYDILYETTSESANSIEIDPNTMIIVDDIVYAQVDSYLGYCKTKIDSVLTPTDASAIPQLNLIYRTNHWFRKVGATA